MRYPIYVLRPTLSLVDTVVHLLGSVFSLTVLGTIVLRLVLDVVSFDFVLSGTDLELQRTVTKLVDIQPDAVSTLLYGRA